MKKFCMITLTVCLLLAALAASPARGEAPAETEPEEAAQIIDLSGYGDEELTALLYQVQAEIVARGIERTAALPNGTYVFGSDIPTGKYLLKKSQTDTYGIVQQAAADDPEDEHPSKLYEFVGERDFEVFITGEEGDKLTIPFPCELTISAGVVFQ